MAPTVAELNVAYEMIRKLDRLEVERITPKNTKGNRLSCTAWESQRQQMLEKFGIEMYFGATKAVFVCKGLDEWVLKISRMNDYDRDYCELEYDHYNLAKTKGFGAYFADIYKLGDFNGITWYIQQKVEVNESKISNYLCDHADDEFFEDIGISREDKESYYPEDIVDDMGVEDRLAILFNDEDFTNFLVDTMENDGVSPDLHSANIGMIDDRFILFDYSGF